MGLQLENWAGGPDFAFLIVAIMTALVFLCVISIPLCFQDNRDISGLTCKISHLSDISVLGEPWA